MASQKTFHSFARFARIVLGKTQIPEAGFDRAYDEVALRELPRKGYPSRIPCALSAGAKLCLLALMEWLDDRL